MTRIAIIGAGNVGGAVYCALREAHGVDDVVLCDTAERQLARIGPIHATRDAAEAARSAETVVIAVKPQSFPELARQLQGCTADKLMISFMAGVSLQAVLSALGSAAIVRAMPNLGAQVRRCVTAWIATRACTTAQRDGAARLFRAAGTELEVPEESLLDAFTALAGSGPAYFFYLAELLAEQAAIMGFGPEQGRLMAREVLAASARLLETGERSPAEWRQAVTTPGGTTEAALSAFVRHGFPESFRLGLEAARTRSSALDLAAAGSTPRDPRAARALPRGPTPR